MIEVHVNEATATVQATDMQALLNPALKRQIVLAVLAEWREQEAYAQRSQDEHGLRAGARRGTAMVV